MRAAVAVIGMHGYKGASQRDIAAEAGVTVAALYHHFASKHDMVSEFIEEAWDAGLERLDRRLRNAPTSADARLDTVIATLITTHLHDEFSQLASKVAVREYRRLEPAACKRITAKRRHLLNTVEQVIADGVAQGVFTTAEPREAARAILYLISSLVEHHPESRRSTAAVIDLYQRFARGIATCDVGAVSAPTLAPN